MNMRSHLKFLPVVLLMVVQVIGSIAVARSQSPVIKNQPMDQPATFDTEALIRAAHNSVPDLIKLLNHPNSQVRSRASTVLGEMGESAKKAIPNLIPLLKDPEAGVRWDAAIALGRWVNRQRKPFPI
jgi:HEAT repeat protein